MKFMSDQDMDEFELMKKDMGDQLIKRDFAIHSRYAYNDTRVKSMQLVQPQKSGEFIRNQAD